MIALLDPPAALVAALAAAGRPATVVRVRPLPDALLRMRKIGDDLAQVPPLALALRRGRFEVAHAFTPAAALAATWAGGRATALTFGEPVRRERLAARRLRLAVLERALAGVGAVVAADDEVRSSLERWLGVDARVIAPGDAVGHAALYDELRRATSSRMSAQRSRWAS